MQEIKLKAAQRLEGFSEYAFASLDEAKKKAERKFKVIDMGVGDPELATHPSIVDAMKSALSMDDAFRYPSYQGESFLRRAFSRYADRFLGFAPDPDSEIIVLIGSKEGIAHLPWAVISKGDTGAYTEPGYPVYKSSIVFAGGNPHAMPINENNDFLPDLGTLPNKTRLVYINYPNNPTAQVAPPSFFKAAIEKAKKNNFLIANDASYIEIFDEERPPSLLSYRFAKDCSVEFYSLSKVFSMTGWRVGFMVGNSKAVSLLGSVKKQIDSGVFRPLQAAAAFALENPELAEGIRKVYSNRIKKLNTALIKSDLFEKIYPTPATFYIWAKVKNNLSSAVFASRLLENTGILCLPGNYMGSSGEGYVRFSTTLAQPDLDAATDRLSDDRLPAKILY